MSAAFVSSIGPQYGQPDYFSTRGLFMQVCHVLPRNKVAQQTSDNTFAVLICAYAYLVYGYFFILFCPYFSYYGSFLISKYIFVGRASPKKSRGTLALNYGVALSKSINSKH